MLIKMSHTEKEKKKTPTLKATLFQVTHKKMVYCLKEKTGDESHISYFILGCF